MRLVSPEKRAQALALLETEFEDEYTKFPRGTFVDILDALSSIEEFSYKPEPEKLLEKQPPPNHPDYERWFRKQLAERQDND